MSGVDIRDLNVGELPQGRFPASPQADFRLHIAPEVHRGIGQHARADASVEICGVLVGRWEADEQGPYAAVTDYIRCEQAASKFAEVTFTHESWAHINKEMDTRFADLRIVGWYHSHPDFGIFLSDRDCFIHEHFFAGPGQVAYVVDPVRGLEGAFAWRNGKPQPLSHYWVGDSIYTVQANARDDSREARPEGGEHDASRSIDRADGPRILDRSPLSMPMLLLALLAVFLLGFLMADWRNRWEQRMIIEGAVAHFGTNKLMRIGWEEELAQVRLHLNAVAAEMRKLPAPSSELSDEEVQANAERRRIIENNLALTSQALLRIGQFYGLSEAERYALARFVADRQAALNALEPAAPAEVQGAPTASPSPPPQSEQGAAAEGELFLPPPNSEQQN